ncbi:MAG: NAD(P)H-hydrate dehydratase [Bacteroidaceae bacterium]|nr:NAD(P)H-hydrate dehydratase [Bacteroidaceae bacterium]
MEYIPITDALISGWLKKRDPFSHKGNYGRASLVAGSVGMIGAALLSARACMRSGVGLLTVHVPECGYAVMQMGIPEAKCIADEHYTHHTNIEIPLWTDVAGIGPGIGQHTQTQWALHRMILNYPEIPMVFDADALNILSQNPQWLAMLPKGSIITPHPGEMQRLGTDPAEMTVQYQLVVVLKGHHTRIYVPKDGIAQVYENTLHGNAGMAVGGSGDVLTGIILALMAQHYTAEEAAVIGVWIHALAADLALADGNSEESLLPSDIISHLGAAFNASRI